MAKTRITISIDDKVFEKMNSLATSQRRTVSNMIEFIMAEKLGMIITDGRSNHNRISPEPSART